MNSTKTGYSLAPSSMTNDEVSGFLATVTTTTIQRQYFDNSRQNPSRFYNTGTRPFFGIWINGHPDPYAEIGWEKTLRDVGNREKVHDVLDFLAYCFREADLMYDWKNEGVAGFSVVGDDSFGMEKGAGFGIQVSFPNTAFPIARHLKNNDAEKLKLRAISSIAEFVHERVHNEYDEMATPGVHPEAVSQGCQFLYLPGENRIFEDQVRQTLKQAGEVITAGSAPLNGYQKHNLVWMAYLQNSLSSRFSGFHPLGNDGLQNIADLGKLISNVAGLRRSLGSEWAAVRKELMRELIEYDLSSQVTIIQDFKMQAAQYGLDKLA